MDPAGNSAADVAKRYPLQAFSDAWIIIGAARTSLIRSEHP